MANDEQLVQLARSGFGLTPSSGVVPMVAGNVNRGARFVAGETTYVLQELNEIAFRDPDALMGNASAVCDRLTELNLPAVRFVRNVEGGWLVDLDGVPWRCYEHIEGETAAAMVTPEEAQSTARMFGRYAAAIEPLDLAEHVPGYHDFDLRIQAFDGAVTHDPLGRSAMAGETIEAAVHLVDRLRLAPSYGAWGELPRRNAHNDAKAPNCVVSAEGTRTIIDLDTTMPGTILADIGELVRSATRALDDRRPDFLMTQIEAVNRGFLAGFDGELTEAESAAMLLAGPLLTVENAVRFLTDYLLGDIYYGAEAEGHNLERAQQQVALAAAQIAAIEDATSI